MANVLKAAAELYASNIKLMLLFSLASAIAFLIPVFAPFPTFNDVGGIFLRTASIYLNLNVLNTAVIMVSVFFSLLFLSFAIVAITVVVKHSRTRTRIQKEVLDGLEKYTGQVFTVLLAYTALLMLTNISTYGTKYPGIATSIVGLAAAPFVFYAPAAIVVDDYRISRAFRRSASLFFKRFDRVLLWLAVAIIALTILDALFIALSGTLLSRYLLLLANAFVVLPFLIVLQSELYMDRFKLLKR